MKEKSLRWAILLGLAFIIALGVAAIAFGQWRSQKVEQGSAPAVFPPSLARAATAQQQYALAAEVAQSWQPDSLPAVISVHRQSQHGRWPTDITWMFEFYSPATHRLAVVAVGGGRTWLLQEKISPYSVPTFTETDWQVNSARALQAWWDAGGATFVALHSEQVDLTTQLRIPPGGEHPVWTIVGLAGDQVWRVAVDGATGELVPD